MWRLLVREPDINPVIVGTILLSTLHANRSFKQGVTDLEPEEHPKKLQFSVACFV